MAITLSNLTSGAPWSPRQFRLEPTSGTYSPIRQRNVESPVAGIGSILLTVSDGVWKRRLFAIYRENGNWTVFDGVKPVPINGLAVVQETVSLLYRWLSLARVTLRTAQSRESILYFRPWFRHTFEGGWALSDVDIAAALTIYVTDSAARQRLKDALDIE